MLKIWLTWLQPSLGLLGTALLLSSTLCARAETKPAAVRIDLKAPAQVSQWSNVKSSGTRIDRELVKKVAPTPDLAVRQLAVNSMVMPAPSAAIEIRPHRRDYASSVISPSLKKHKSSANVAKFHALNRQSNHDIASVLSQAINPQTAPIPVPGIYIGNSNGRTASKFTPKSVKSVVPSNSVATQIGAPTPLSAMMAAKPSIDPFPVVRPELMQKLERMPVTASLPKIDKVTPTPLNPIATIPPAKASKSVVSTIVSPQATIPVKSLDPIAAIPSGLQRLLGNNLNSQPVAPAPVATAVVPKTNPMLALRQFVSPTVASLPSSSVNGASLQLATAQAYTANLPKFSIPGEQAANTQTYTAKLPKFSIPGETLAATKPLRSVVQLTAVKPSQKSFMVTGINNSKSTYLTSRLPAVSTNQSWTVVDRPNNLGGLILGSQQRAAAPQVASLLARETSASTELPIKALVDIN